MKIIIKYEKGDKVWYPVLDKKSGKVISLRAGVIIDTNQKGADIVNRDLDIVSVKESDVNSEIYPFRDELDKKLKGIYEFLDRVDRRKEDRERQGEEKEVEKKEEETAGSDSSSRKRCEHVVNKGMKWRRTSRAKEIDKAAREAAVKCYESPEYYKSPWRRIISYGDLSIPKGQFALGNYEVGHKDWPFFSAFEGMLLFGFYDGKTGENLYADIRKEFPGLSTSDIKYLICRVSRHRTLLLGADITMPYSRKFACRCAWISYRVIQNQYTTSIMYRNMTSKKAYEELANKRAVSVDTIKKIVRYARERDEYEQTLSETVDELIEKEKNKKKVRKTDKVGV